MILADTSVWIDHLRHSNDRLVQRLQNGEICCHPHIIVELGLGSLRNRSGFLPLLEQLPQSPLARHAEIMKLTGQRNLYSLGIGFVDIHLIASCLIDRNIRLWALDNRLHRVAMELDLADTPAELPD